MQIDKYTHEKYFEIIRGWWRKRERSIPDKDHFPPTGFMVSDVDGRNIVAGFLFKTDANIAIMDFIISDPEPMTPSVRDKAVNFLLSTLVKEAYEGGFKLVTAATNLPRLGVRYERMGFLKADSNEVHYGRIL